MLHALLSKVLSPWMWRNAESRAKRFHSFSETEASSRLDLLLAANLSDSPEDAAKFIRHASDEARHARSFRQLAAQEGVGSRPMIVDHEGLYERLGDARFVAFVHRGECRGRDEFQTYATHFKNKNENAHKQLQQIYQDEVGHAAYTLALLKKKNPTGYHSDLLSVGRWELWRTWRRSGQKISSLIYVALMSTIYLLASPYALFLRKYFRQGWK